MTQGGSPGLRDNAPLALKDGHDFSLGFSISSKVRVSIEDRAHYILGRTLFGFPRFSFTRNASRFEGAFEDRRSGQDPPVPHNRSGKIPQQQS